MCLEFSVKHYVTFYSILQDSERGFLKARLSDGEACYTVICTVYFCMKHLGEQNFFDKQVTKPGDSERILLNPQTSDCLAAVNFIHNFIRLSARL